MSNEAKLVEHIREIIPDKNANVSRAKGDFWNMANSSSVVSWGWTEPIAFEGFRFVYFSFSPKSKGQKGSVFYDFITEEEYQQKKNVGKS